ncbi:MAG: ExeM/NucH family extracellular endonuclease [Leadbetterella sp.]|nr:ExeM/NucH family extracellular endonuclease [Leadbetterella sp.]
MIILRFFFLCLISSCAFAQQMNITPIPVIQGQGKVSALVGQKVAVNGIVTAVFAGKQGLEGFFIQESIPDDDENTSEGLFIYDPAQTFKGKTGNLVQIIGEVAELKSARSSLTQIKNVSSILILTENNKLPDPVTVTLPNDNWERYEGMRVRVKAAEGNLFVTELYQLGRYGQLTLCSTGPENQPGTDGRLDQFTQFNTPDAEGYKHYLTEMEKRKIVLDDGSGVRNPAQLPFGREGKPFDMYHAVRGGDQAKEVIGIVDDRFDAVRIQPTETVWFKPTAKRLYTPPRIPRKSTLKVAAFNVLNYFNGDGQGGGFPTERGATTPEELKRQQDKTVNVILTSGADVLSLMEIENDGFGEYSAIQTLIRALNQASGNKRNFVACEVENRGTDVITSAILYDSKKVMAVGPTVSMPDGYGTASFDSARRKPIIQTLRELKSEQEFTLVAVHFKSKGIQSFGAGNEDKLDGQGRNNEVRVQQAEDLKNWLDTRPTGTQDPDYLLMGDFNSYAQEDPLLYLDAYHYKNLFPLTSYSYVYDAQWGSLDHALATPGLMSQVTRAVKWHINSEEATILDYNTEFKTPEQVKNYYDASMFRSSDHDPLIIGLKLKKASVDHAE